jgi:hypothetical protein
MARTEELIKTVLGTANPLHDCRGSVSLCEHGTCLRSRGSHGAVVLFFASSGTGVMEASLVNILAPGERVLMCIHGQFGERFAAIAKALGAQVDLRGRSWSSIP